MENISASSRHQTPGVRADPLQYHSLQCALPVSDHRERRDDRRPLGWTRRGEESMCGWHCGTRTQTGVVNSLAVPGVLQIMLCIQRRRRASNGAESWPKSGVHGPIEERLVLKSRFGLPNSESGWEMEVEGGMTRQFGGREYRYLSRIFNLSGTNERCLPSFVSPNRTLALCEKVRADRWRRGRAVHRQIDAWITSSNLNNLYKYTYLHEYSIQGFHT